MWGVLSVVDLTNLLLGQPIRGSASVGELSMSVFFGDTNTLNIYKILNCRYNRCYSDKAPVRYHVTGEPRELEMDDLKSLGCERKE